MLFSSTNRGLITSVSSSAHLTASSFPCRLTAFVYRSFAQAGRFIYIDDRVQSQTLLWLSSKQKLDGCFRSVGTLFNNALKVPENYFLVKFIFFIKNMFSYNCQKLYFTPNASLLPRANSPQLIMSIFSSVSFCTHALHVMCT